MTKTKELTWHSQGVGRKWAETEDGDFILEKTMNKVNPWALYRERGHERFCLGFFSSFKLAKFRAEEINQ